MGGVTHAAALRCASTRTFFCAEHCLYVFSACLVLTNVSASLVASAIGAARPSTAVANVAGALVALYFALFGGFVISKDAIAPGLQVATHSCRRRGVRLASCAPFLGACTNTRRCPAAVGARVSCVVLL